MSHMYPQRPTHNRAGGWLDLLPAPHWPAASAPTVVPATETVRRTPRPEPGRRSPACRHSGSPRRTNRFRLGAIICDIDQVVLMFDPHLPQRIEQRYHLHEGSLLSTLVDLPTAKLASVGALSHTRWLQYARQSLPPQAVDEWLAHHGTLNQPVVDILAAAAKAGVRVFFLANSTDRLRDDLAHHNLGDLAERTYNSADTGYAKPDPRAYEHVIDTACLNPHRTLYIDDNPSWVRAGRQLGMRGHQYTDAARLREELVQAGVPV